MRRSSNPNVESIDETDDSPVEGLEEGTLAIGNRTNSGNVTGMCVDCRCNKRV